MTRRSPRPAHLLLAVSLVWATAVAVDRGVATGDWLVALGGTGVLLAVAGLLGLLAAVLDDLIDDLLRGGGGVR